MQVPCEAGAGAAEEGEGSEARSGRALCYASLHCQVSPAFGISPDTVDLICWLYFMEKVENHYLD